MKIRTQRQLIQAVAKRWWKQYQPFKDDKPLFSWRTGITSPPLNKQQIADKLDDLDGDTATAADVSAIIGSDSWTALKCDECKEYVTATIKVGDEPDYESHTAELCLNCAEKAAALIRGMRVPTDREGEKPREPSGALEPRSNSGESSGLVGVGGVLTNEQRVANYCRETGYPQHLFVGGDGRIVGTMIMGQNYTVKSAYYGGYPHGYLARVKALFPDKQNVLHLFSGRVEQSTLPGKTIDINAENAPDYVDDAQTLERVPLCDFDLVCADPPYSVEDCEHYKTTMVKRNVVMRALGKRLRKGTHVVWLDQVLPMYRKDQFDLVGVIGMVKSTNHRFRVCSIFRAGGGGAEPGDGNATPRSGANSDNA